jgi:nucleoid DNA-binding protein
MTTKAEIVDAVQSGTGVSNKDAVVLVESLFEMIKDELEKGENIKNAWIWKFYNSEQKRAHWQES